MDQKDSENTQRYDRQVRFPAWNDDAQRTFAQSKALIVGVGGLGSWAAELLARAGIGELCLVDNDTVDWTNIHRQAMYDAEDAENRTPKAIAAKRRIAQINYDVCVEAHIERVDAGNIAELADGADVILDGTDNFRTRFLLNDYAVKTGVPWVFAGVVEAEAQVLPVLPRRSGCLCCLYDQPEDAHQPASRGVLGPAVSAIASIQTLEAMKILAGKFDAVRPGLLKIDLWNNSVQQIGARRDPACECCGD